MEIAPIPGVRAVALQRKPRASDEHRPPFDIEAAERAEDNAGLSRRRPQDEPGESTDSAHANPAREDAAGTDDSSAEAEPARTPARIIDVVA